MRIATAAGLTGLALISLSACNKTAPAASASAAPPPTSVAAATPHHREGLWEQKMTIEGMGVSTTTQLCVDKSFQEARAFTPQSRSGHSNCSNYSASRQLNGDWSFSATCPTGRGGTVTTNGVVHGDFDSAYRMEATTTISGADVPQMNRTMKMTMEAKWLGPCTPGQKSGDMVVNGMKIHIPGRRFDSADVPH